MQRGAIVPSISTNGKEDTTSRAVDQISAIRVVRFNMFVPKPDGQINVMHAMGRPSVTDAPRLAPKRIYRIGSCYLLT